MSTLVRKNIEELRVTNVFIKWIAPSWLLRYVGLELPSFSLLVDVFQAIDIPNIPALVHGVMMKSET